MIKIKPSLNALKPYIPNKAIYKIKLDANESKNYLSNQDLGFEIENLNRYPDSDATILREKIGQYIQVPYNNIIVGNGSSEMIELILKTYVEPNDVVLSYEPTFSMYSIYTKIYSGNYQYVSTDNTFQLNIEDMINSAKQLNPKIIFLCTPNNPTGQRIPYEDIIQLIQNTDALVCVDEAYIEFTDQVKSLVTETQNFNNLAVLRTFSKAYGLAGIRLGYLVSNTNIVNTLNRVKSPYNLNSVTQMIGINALKFTALMEEYTRIIRNERVKLEQALQNLNLVVYPSQANFVFFYSKDELLYDKLMDRGILIRGFKDSLKGYYRVTVGDAFENQMFIQALKEILL